MFFQNQDWKSGQALLHSTVVECCILIGGRMYVWHIYETQIMKTIRFCYL